MQDNNQTQLGEFAELIKEGKYVKFPKVGDVIRGKILSINSREIRLDIDGLTTGVIRGKELFSGSAEFASLKKDDIIEATVLDLENEGGEMELSIRFSGQKKAWEDLYKSFSTGETLQVKILDANKGGLIVKIQNIAGFLPVSQLSPEHYPRVSGGDKQKILDKLKSYVNETFKARIIDVNEAENKLIVSEKALWEEEQKNVIGQFKVGDKIEGTITALADFGAFIKFPTADGEELEGLVHISEIAWQRIDHPQDILTVGQKVTAEIIGIEGSKIFLSMKKMIDDPWKNVADKYVVGQKVEGTVLKINPFGLFVELDPEIHGLAHISELSDGPVEDISKIAKSGDRITFTIVSVEPNEHRLGLSLKTAPILHQATIADTITS